MSKPTSAGLGESSCGSPFYRYCVTAISAAIRSPSVDLVFVEAKGWEPSARVVIAGRLYNVTYDYRDSSLAASLLDSFGRPYGGAWIAADVPRRAARTYQFDRALAESLGVLVGPGVAWEARPVKPEAPTGLRRALGALVVERVRNAVVLRTSGGIGWAWACELTHRVVLAVPESDALRVAAAAGHREIRTRVLPLTATDLRHAIVELAVTPEEFAVVIRDMTWAR